MNSDTPTADGIPHSLDCPDCSSAVFARPVAHWTHGESEYCPGCGSSLRVSLEEHDGDSDELTAVAVSYEHGGEVVARLLADVGRLNAERDALWEEGIETTAALQADRDVVWAERVEEGKVAARAGREAAHLRERVSVLEGAIAECYGSGHEDETGPLAQLKSIEACWEMEHNDSGKFAAKCAAVRSLAERDRARGWEYIAALDGTPTRATLATGECSELLSGSDVKCGQWARLSGMCWQHEQREARRGADPSSDRAEPDDRCPSCGVFEGEFCHEGCGEPGGET